MSELRRRLFTKSFFGAASIVFLSMFMFSLPGMLELPSIYTSRVYYPSALFFVLDSMYYGGFLLVLPLCAVLPHIDAQIGDITSRFILLKVHREGIRKYVGRTISASSISSILAVCGSFLLYVLLCNFLFIPSNPDEYATHWLPFEHSIYASMYGVYGGTPMYLYLLLMIGCSCITWTLVGLALAVHIPERITVLTATVILHNLWTYGLRIIIPELPSPSALFNDGLTASILLRGIVLNTAIAIGSCILYSSGVKRRILHA